MVTQDGGSFFSSSRLGREGGQLADGPGNSVPRFHIVWGTGPGIVEPFERRVREHMKKAWSNINRVTVWSN